MCSENRINCKVIIISAFRVGPRVATVGIVPSLPASLRDLRRDSSCSPWQLQFNHRLTESYTSTKEWQPNACSVGVTVGVNALPIA